MLNLTRTYTDYNGNTRTEEFHFNLTPAEITEMEVSVEGGLVDKINRITASQDGREIIRLFKDIILQSYGEKSPDGRRFIKSKELSEAFSQTEAFSDLFMELATDPEAAAKFVNGIIPQQIANPKNDKKPGVINMNNAEEHK